MKQLLIPLALLVTMPVQAGDYNRPGGTQQTRCYENVYREEYIPGTRNNPGRVRRYSDRVRVPCDGQEVTRGEYNTARPAHPMAPGPVSGGYHGPDDNSCIEGSVLGGIVGGAIGAGLSRDEGMIVGIPLGIVGGALVGCQIDGG